MRPTEVSFFIECHLNIIGMNTLFCYWLMVCTSYAFGWLNGWLCYCVNSRCSCMCPKFASAGSGVTIEGLLLFPVEAITTPVAETKAAAEKDDDCDVDLFGDETKEEKRLLDIVQ